MKWRTAIVSVTGTNDWTRLPCDHWHSFTALLVVYCPSKTLPCRQDRRHETTWHDQTWLVTAWRWGSRPYQTDAWQPVDPDHDHTEWMPKNPSTFTIRHQLFLQTRSWRTTPRLHHWFVNARTLIWRVLHPIWCVARSSMKMSTVRHRSCRVDCGHLSSSWMSVVDGKLFVTMLGKTNSLRWLYWNVTTAGCWWKFLVDDRSEHPWLHQMLRRLDWLELIYVFI